MSSYRKCNSQVNYLICFMLSFPSHTHIILKFHYLCGRKSLPLAQMRLLYYKCQCLLPRHNACKAFARLWNVSWGKFCQSYFAYFLILNQSKCYKEKNMNHVLCWVCSLKAYWLCFNYVGTYSYVCMKCITYEMDFLLKGG